MFFSCVIIALVLAEASQEVSERAFSSRLKNNWEAILLNFLVILGSVFLRNPCASFLLF